MIKFGPAGNSDSFYNEGFKSTLEAPKWLRERNLDLYEISFGRGIIFTEAYAEKLKIELDKYNIESSIHAPYYINFANPDEEMAKKSIDYVLNALKILRILGGKYLVVHSGTQMKLDREYAFSLVIKRYKELITKIYELGLDDMYVCPETMGKYSQIGDIDEIIEICKLDKILIPTFDFGHINCIHQGSIKTKEDYRKIIEKCKNELGEFKTDKLHIHFSKIEFTEKGEKKHLTFKDDIYGPNFEPLIDVLLEYNLSPTIICESNGTMAEDAKIMKIYYENTKNKFRL